MAQVKVYALASSWQGQQKTVSDVIHSCIVETFGLPEEKRFHRFIMLDRNNFLFPADRSDNYMIIEISCFEGRTTETKKTLIRELFIRLGKTLDISSQDVEITITETPKSNWGIRGLPADELQLHYKVEK